MNIKKLISLLLAAAMILSLAACSTQEDTKTQTGTDSYSADTAFTFTDSAITADGESTGYEIDGTHLKIESSGTYLLSGSCSDGSIEIKKGTTGVTLILDGLELESSDTAPIACNKSTEVTILVADGSVNSLSDSEKNNDDEYADNENAENAVIKCKDGSQVTICGTGTLNITANGKNGIKSGATTDEEGEASLTIKELTLNISAPVNDAINAEQLLNIESGTLNISAGDDAVHCDLTLNVGADGTDGPTISISECYEGLEASELNVLSGDISILSSDDCMNAANSDLTGASFVINISGGTIVAYASDGDGFDSNGDLNISGGTVVVWTANRADNQPLDADGTLSVTGGTVLAAGGSSGTALSISAEQAYVNYGSTGGMGGGSSLISKGDVISIKDESGTELYSGAASCDAAYVFFSSADLSTDASYSLYVGSDSVSSATAQTGTSTSGGGGMGGGNMQPNGGQAPDGSGGDMQPPDGQGGGQMPSGDPPAKPQ